MANRSQTFPSGGAYLTWNGATWNMRDKWMVVDDPKTFKVPSNTLGESIDERIGDITSKITCTPKVFLATLAAQQALLWPYTNPVSQLGALIYPAADLAAEIVARDLKTITYPAAQLTKMPELMFAADKPLAGPMELTCILKAGTIAGAAGSHDVVATAEAYAEPNWSPGNELFDSYAFTLGTGGGAVNFTPDKDGVKCTPTLSLDFIKPAMQTTIQARITDIGLDIEFRPLDMDVDTFYATYFPMEGANVALGGSIRSSGLPLTITGATVGGATLAVPLVARSKTAGPVFDNKESRISKVTLHAMSTYSGGAWQPLFTLGVVPAPM